MQYNISIFGSCISRDILDYDKDHFLPEVYVARQSFVSSVFPPSTIDPDSICLTSAFQKRVVGWDLNKKAFEVLSPHDDSSFLLIDFFEERFDLVECGGSIATFSNEFAQSGLQYNNRFSWHTLDDVVGGGCVSAYFEDFISRVLSIYAEQNIVLIMGLLCDTYRTLDGNVKPFDKATIEWNKRKNQKLIALYDRFRQLVPRANVIDICSSYRCYEGNKWGLASTHYEESYYRKAANMLLRIVERRKEPLYNRLYLFAKSRAIAAENRKFLSELPI